MKYIGDDAGSVKKLTCIQAPKELYLKRGAPVVLLCNINDNLVNGLRGRVMLASSQRIDVLFNGHTHVYSLKKHTFLTRDADGAIVATRRQYPIKLAFALTVHKSQGMTLKNVIVDAKHMRNRGQLAVALSRVRSSDDVVLRNFNRNLLIPQPSYIQTYYDGKHEGQVLPDKSCCINQVVKQSPQSVRIELTAVTSDDQDLNVEDEELHSDFNMTLDEVKELDAVVLTFLATVKYPSPLTSNQEQLNDLITLITTEALRSKRQRFMCEVYKHVNITCKCTLSDHTPKNRDTSKFYKLFHAYLSCDEYIGEVAALFKETSVTISEMVYSLCYRIVEFLRVQCFKVALENLGSLADVEPTKIVDKHTEANIRYIAGWCTGTILKAKKLVVYRSLYCQKDVAQQINNEVTLLETMLCSTDEPETLTEIERKNYIPGALKAVSPELLRFFCQLDKEIQSSETVQNINEHGRCLYEVIAASLVESDSLNDAWISACNDASFSNVKDELILKYLTMSARYFIKEYKKRQNVKSKLAHRKQILVSGEQHPSSSSQTRRKRQKTMAAYPCGKCSKECEASCVLCEKCDKWFHYKCVGLTGKEAALADDAPPWFCLTCTNL